MLQFYVIIALTLALLYSHRKRFTVLARRWWNNKEGEERAKREGENFSINLEEVVEEIHKVNESISELPNLILDAMRENLEEEQKLRVAIMTDQQDMRTRLGTFDAMARALHRSILLINSLENKTEAVNTHPLESPLPPSAPEDRILLEREYDVPWASTEIRATPEAHLASLSVPSKLESFVDQNIERINRAGYEGLRGIRTFLENSESAIELHSPSDGIAVLTEREAGPGPEGRAFVLPGQLLGRPWVEWFEVPKELVCPIEGTVLPAIVFGRGDGTWQLKRKGRVSQQ